MVDEKIRTIEELKKAVNSDKVPIDSTMVVEYGNITLYVENDGYKWAGTKFRQSLKVVQEIIPEGMVVTIRKKRPPKPPEPLEPKSQATKASGKK